MSIVSIRRKPVLRIKFQVVKVVTAFPLAEANISCGYRNARYYLEAGQCPLRSDNLPALCGYTPASENS